MPDDNQTVTEPRSAVEAASDPSHGGSVAMSNEDYRAVSQAQIAYPKYADDAANAAAPRTIVSGVERLEHLVDVASKALAGAMGFAEPLIGSFEASIMPDGPPGDKSLTQDRIHTAVSRVEAVFADLSSLISRAKAAHG